MSGDHLKKVKSGDPLAFPAATFNAFVDAARAHQAGQRSINGEGTRSVGHITTVNVQNASGSDVGRFGVLGIDGPAIGPEQNLAEFQGRPTLKGVTPVAGTHNGTFVVLLDPVGDGRIGRGCAAGVTVAKIDVADESHTHADIANGVTAHLASGTSGAARILWKESGTGEKWALLRLGDAAITGKRGGQIALHFQSLDGYLTEGAFTVWARIPWDMTLTGWELTHDGEYGYASYTVDVRLCGYDEDPGFVFPRPTDYNSIIGTGTKPSVDGPYPLSEGDVEDWEVTGLKKRQYLVAKITDVGFYDEVQNLQLNLIYGEGAEE